MKMVCVKNDSKREIEIGKVYEVYHHDNPNVYWVVLDDKFKQQQCYRSDFVPISKMRNDKINSILD